MQAFGRSGDPHQQPVFRFMENVRARGFFTLYDVFNMAWELGGGDLSTDGVKSILGDIGVRLAGNSSHGDGGEGPSLALGDFEKEEIAEEEEAAQRPEMAEIRYEELESPIAMYLREIDRGPLLTAEQEVDLAKRIERGNKAAEKLKKAAPDEEGR